MGIVLKQSLQNTIITFIGFGVAAINAIFLYTRFLTDEYYGLVVVILSTSAILSPLLAFGVPNTLVKYYSSFQGNKETDGFLTLMLFLPLVFILPVAGISYVAHDVISGFLSKTNIIVKDYVWYIFFIGMAMAYFEIFHAWTKVQLKSVFGNFMKEVFVRLGVMVLLFLVYFEVISVALFLKLLVALYVLRMLVMKIYAYRLKMPKLQFSFPENTSTILKYSLLIILGGSAAAIILEVDRFMISQYIKIENVAYYSVAIYMATVIAVPSRSMHQITYPLTAELLNKKDALGLKELYQKSSLTLFIISGLFFVLIILNLNDIYYFLPENYHGGFIVVFFIGLTKVYDAMLGNSNAILYNSDYYQSILLMGIFLALITIGFNIWLIPIYQLKGAALATFLAICIYNTIKFAYVKAKFGIQPFTIDTFKVFALLLLLGLPLYFIEVPFHPLLNIAIKSLGIILVYLAVLHRFKISDDVSRVISGFFRK